VSRRSAFCSFPLQDEVQSPKSSLLKFHAPDASNLSSSATREDVFFFPIDRLAPRLQAHYLHTRIYLRVSLTSIARKDLLCQKMKFVSVHPLLQLFGTNRRLLPTFIIRLHLIGALSTFLPRHFHSPSTNSLIRPPSSRLATNVWKKPLGLVNICVPASSAGTHRWRSANSIVSLFCSA
jgi:hypothetical protein